MAALGALSQETRLDVFRLLVRRGPEGLSAGQIGGTLGIVPATLSFHLAQLSHAELIDMRRDGRFLIYAVAYPAIRGLLRFLIEDCCRGVDTESAPSIAADSQPVERTA